MPFQNLVLVTLGVIVIAAINNSPKLVAALIKLKKEYFKNAENSAKEDKAVKEAPKATNRVNLFICLFLFIMCIWTLVIAVPWRPNPESLSDLLLFHAFAISMSTSIIAVMVAWFMNRK